ncbi:hypothetical protein DFH08DRAFT_903962 [Mycena albidolilacea]|uniref:Uncharacterized protein n=1 Tax=Mycena albidolilacea TaxID=1033008 RepID=A0AAD6Z1N3_9AGAR|nr:hypothetical protein DFH08DRAFT_903962 [Mycena albidolilacea]
MWTNASAQRRPSRRGFKLAIVGIMGSKGMRVWVVILRFCISLQADRICCISSIGVFAMEICRTCRWKKEAGFELDRIACRRCLTDEDHRAPSGVTTVYFIRSIHS